jgi:predicted nucleic acid-binding protein
MTVVSDTSPLNYLVLIEQAGVLPRLYGRVLIPRSVHEELSAPETPAPVRAWVGDLPGWVEISNDPPAADESLGHLHAGERDAISLALRSGAGALLVDERRGREEAEKRGVKVIGTLGVLVAAYENGLLDLTEALGRLRQTTFHVSPKLLAAILQKYRGAEREGGAGQ